MRTSRRWIREPSGKSSAARRRSERRGSPAKTTQSRCLRTKADRLSAAERQRAEIERALVDLEVADSEATWMPVALRELANVWRLMTAENQGRPLRALVAAVRVKEATGLVEIELAADARSKEAP
jgi:hypothetical protein